MGSSVQYINFFSFAIMAQHMKGYKLFASCVRKLSDISLGINRAGLAIKQNKHVLRASRWRATTESFHGQIFNVVQHLNIMIYYPRIERLVKQDKLHYCFISSSALRRKLFIRK